MQPWVTHIHPGCLAPQDASVKVKSSDPAFRHYAGLPNFYSETFSSHFKTEEKRKLLAPPAGMSTQTRKRTETWPIL